jgi:hypothetical protein
MCFPSSFIFFCAFSFLAFPCLSFLSLLHHDIFQSSVSCHAGHSQHWTLDLVLGNPVSSQPLIRMSLTTLKATWLRLDSSPLTSEFMRYQKFKMQRYVYFHNRPEHY